MEKNWLVLFSFAVLTVIAGVILTPSVAIHGALAAGDHGLSYYAFDHAAKGERIYQDFQWIYGPVMPIYYGAMERLFGDSILGIMTGKAVLNLLSGLILFFTVAGLAGSFLGFAAAMWFLAFTPDFYYTPNHAGGLLVITFIVLCVTRYVTRRNTFWLWLGLASAFLLAFIKLNFGVTAVAILVLTAFIVDCVHKASLTREQKLFYLTACLLVPTLVVAGYFLLLRGLSVEEMNQCLPYFIDGKAYSEPALPLIMEYFTRSLRHFSHSRLALITIGIMLLAGFSLIIQRKSWPDARRKELFLILLLLGIYGLFNLHEFIKSGIPHRLPWSQPIGIVLMFYILGQACRDTHAVLRISMIGIMLLLSGVTITKNLDKAGDMVTSDHFLALGKARVYVTNDRQWIDTIDQTTAYINSHLAPDQYFFALPFDPLLYYLTDRRSPTRMFLFFQFIDMSPEQELKIIAELEAKHTNMIVRSNRIKSSEVGLGEFGVTHNRILSRYIDQHFVPAVRFGDWQNEPGWDDNLGYEILRRTSSVLGTKDPS